MIFTNYQEILVIFRNGGEDRCDNSREETWRISWKYQDISQLTRTANIENILSKPDWRIGLRSWACRCEGGWNLTKHYISILQLSLLVDC